MLRSGSLVSLAVEGRRFEADEAGECEHQSNTDRPGEHLRAGERDRRERVAAVLADRQQIEDHQH